MTTREAIKQADALRPNCIEAEAKYNILRKLESGYAELMETLQVINPRLYAGVIKKLKA